MDQLTLAYLAGAMDADGYFSIKKSTYHIRVRGDAVNAVYSEKMGLKQVTPIVPLLLQEAFGGSYRQDRAQTENSKPMFGWTATDQNAARVCESLLPYLRIKPAQARKVLELRESKKPGYGKLGYWFLKEFPDWQAMELITTGEAAALLNYKSREMVSQAIRLGMLVGLPYDYSGNERPRVPRLLVERALELRGKDERCRLLPKELVEWRARLWAEVRELNKIGVNGTPIYHRSGPYAPA